ncbi:nucleoside diphosphate kinase [Actinoplanes sp. SE50]|nr:nucleoside-diphosphate kinase [Actinoplanes sp. SE50]AEV85948.1 Nucleoside diphosphate kinase [Actinoplanes sp. SE50/110]ATO84346.1 nucleoside diphosphate kinase [Actinoplanes sp. SE50]SLM01756.1 nucleoside-diphosphate kinase [Actinoplanes sp. SE50/110]
MERAFVLLKPDCLRTGRSSAVESVITAEGLRIACRHPLTLTPADTRLLWSEYTDEGHVLMRALLDRYLCTAPSAALLLTGPNAFEAARRVKRTIRSRYANGPFANLVHTAETPAELARQATHLFSRPDLPPVDHLGYTHSAPSDAASHRPTDGRPPVRHPAPAGGPPPVDGPAPVGGPPRVDGPAPVGGLLRVDGPAPVGGLLRVGGPAPATCSGECAPPFLSSDASPNAPRPTGRDFRQDADIPALVTDLWPLLQATDPPPPPPYHLDDHAQPTHPATRDDAALYLGADRAHSLDSAVTAIWSALPGITLPRALTLMLYASRVDGYPIAIGSHHAIAQSHRILLQHQLTACGIGPIHQRWASPIADQPAKKQ